MLAGRLSHSPIFLADIYSNHGEIRGQIEGNWLREKGMNTYIQMFFQGCGSGFGSGSRRAKMTHKSIKKLKISCFEVLDVLL
jgi:hypothetical protein